MDHLSVILSKLAHLDLSGQIEDIQPTARGLGASCDVFTGYWGAGNKTVAVKKLRIFLSKEDQVVKKLAREAYIWSKLEHNNVLPLLGFFLEGGEFPHLVSEWMEKGTLHDYMPNLGRGMEVVEMARGIAAGLAYLHEKGVIHADLKSFNVLISPSKGPLLADFGVSHVLAASMTKMCGTTVTSAKGTVRWMAIEFLTLMDESGVGAIPNEKSDVWAFGMTLFEILKREVPYSHLKSDPQVTLAISKGKLPERPSRTEKAALPLSERKLWDLCGSCWKKKPEMRPSMRDLHSEIDALREEGSRPAKKRKMDSVHTEKMVSVPSAEATTSRLYIPNPRISDNNNAFLDYFLDYFDVNNVPPALKKKGGDWFAVFNPKVKRQLDVNLVHTLSHESVVCCLRFSADGRFLASGCNRSAQIYDVKTGTKTRFMVDDELGNRDLLIRSVCFSPDGKYLATGAEDMKIRIWDIAKQEIHRVFKGHQQEVYTVVFSPDGRFLISGSGDKTVRMWDMVSGAQKVLEIMAPETVDAGVTSVAMSSDGRFVAAGSLDSTVYIWDSTTEVLVERLHGHVDCVYSVAFTANGEGLLSGSLDNTVKHWDITPISRPGTKRKLTKDDGERRLGRARNFMGHRDYVLSVAISHDDRWVISGSKDRGVHFWDQQTAEVHLRLEGHKNSVVTVDMSPQGSLFATGSGDCQGATHQTDPIACLPGSCSLTSSSPVPPFGSNTVTAIIERKIDEE